MRTRMSSRAWFRTAALAAGPMVLAATIASAAMPIGKNGLPTTFAGEALTVAFAFAFPALAAGAYLAVRGAARRLGLRGLLIIGMVGIIGAFGAVIVDQRPDLLSLSALTKLAER